MKIKRAIPYAIKNCNSYKPPASYLELLTNDDEHEREFNFYRFLKICCSHVLNFENMMLDS